jgi:hypothetical protein
MNGWVGLGVMSTAGRIGFKKVVLTDSQWQ